MAADPNFAAYPRSGVVAAAVNTLTNGTGSIAEIITAGTNGTLVTEVVLVGTGDVAACVVHLWVYNGSAWALFHSVAVTDQAATSTTVAAWRQVIQLDDTDEGLNLPTGHKLGVTVTVAPTSGNVVAFAKGKDY